MAGAKQPCPFESVLQAHYVDGLKRSELVLTAIIILALVAVFVGLRLYSVLGERTGHEQQPILKPADPDARAEPRPAAPTHAPISSADGADLAYLPTAGPGGTAILASDFR